MDIIELFRYMIKIKSETPDDGELLQFIEDYLPDFKAIRLDSNNVKNLFIYKKFCDGPHLCFAGHVDVVPAGTGWKYPPYDAVINDSFIYGRGTQDMKSGVAAFIQAVKNTNSFNGTLSLMLTSDEEGEAKHGTLEILKYLKSKFFLPNSCIVAEPTCQEKFGDTIKIGRRGSINGYIKIQGRQGHAAYPDKNINPIHQISKILDKISGVNLDNGDKYFAPSKLVITSLNAGMQVTNVTPDILSLMFNVRNSTKTTSLDVKNFIDTNFINTNYSLELQQSAYPFITNSDCKIVNDINQAIKETISVQPFYSTAGGTSDARFISKYGVNVVEFGVKNDTIHAINERTSIKEVERLYEIFKKLIQIHRK